MSHTPFSARRRTVRWSAVSITALLMVTLTACAPEPIAGSPDKTGETPNAETEWGGAGTDEYQPTTELPDSFPSELFALPSGAHVVDTGERGDQQWFVVLQAESPQAADEIWNEIIERNQLTVSGEDETSEGGRVATLSNISISVEALTIPKAEGAVQLNYELVSIASEKKAEEPTTD